MSYPNYPRWKIWLLDKIASALRVDVRINAVHYGHVIWDDEKNPDN